MATKELKALLAAVKKAGFDWQAGETTVSAMSEKQQDGLLGLRVDKKELALLADLIKTENKLQAFASGLGAPAAVDWRNKGGDWTTQIKNQSPCGSCVSFGVLATVEARCNIASGNPNRNEDFSEAFLFYCGCGKCCKRGWNFQPALDFCKNDGVAKESAYPYTPVDQPCKSGVSPFLKITGSNRILSIADRKNILATKGPMVAGMAVYSDFGSYSGGVYRKTPNATLRGYHAICVVGYDDQQECWICKNSWGPGWGDNGWFRIGYGECGIDTQFPFYDVDVPCKPVDMCKRYLPYLRKVLAAARSNARLRACLCYYVCRMGKRPRCTSAEINIVRTVLKILKRCPKYRAPFCRALGCRPEDPCTRYLPYLRKVLAAARGNARLRACLCYYVCRKGRRPLCTRADIAVVRRVLDILRRCPKYRVPFCRALRCK